MSSVAKKIPTGKYFFRNDFYSGLTKPSAVIALNSPTLGLYELDLIRRLAAGRHKQSLRAPTVPLIVCADGAFNRLKRVQQHTVMSSATGAVDTMIDFVVGDFDSIKDASASSAVGQPSDESLVVDQACQRAEDFNFNEKASTAHHRPRFVRVCDQDTNDFEKCLTICELALTSKAHREEVNVVGGSSRPLVVVVGFQGGEWHHEMAALHVASKFSSARLDVRLHSPYSTIMFCPPNGTAEFERNAAFETDVVGIVPFGPVPHAVKTQGLQWELDVQSCSPDTNFFGYYSGRKVSYISTSNRILGSSLALECRNLNAPIHDAWCNETLGVLGGSVALSINCKREDGPALLKTDAVAPSRRPHVGVSILVVFRAANMAPRFLIIKRGKAPFLYSFPGGSVEAQETTLEAAMRELREETGISTDVVSFHKEPLKVMEVIPRAGEPQRSHFVLVQYVAYVTSKCLLTPPVVDAADDALVAAWWSLDAIQLAETSGATTAGLTVSIEYLQQREREASWTAKSHL